VRAVHYTDRGTSFFSCCYLFKYGGIFVVVNLHRHTVRKYMKKNVKTNVRKKRSPSVATRSRQKEVLRLAGLVTKKNGRSWPTYGSARQIEGALFNQSGTVVSLRQVQRDLRAAGLRPYAGPTLTTRCVPDLTKKSKFAKKITC